MHYGIGHTAQRVKTGCGKRIKYTTPWTTAAARVKCPDCLDSLAWINLEGRFGIGEPDVQVHDEIAMEPQPRGSRFKTRRQQKASEE